MQDWLDVLFDPAFDWRDVRSLNTFRAYASLGMERHEKGRFATSTPGDPDVPAGELWRVKEVVGFMLGGDQKVSQYARFPRQPTSRFRFLGRERHNSTPAIV